MKVKLPSGFTFTSPTVKVYALGATLAEKDAASTVQVTMTGSNPYSLTFFNNVLKRTEDQVDLNANINYAL
jgi:hypothetical protein